MAKGINRAESFQKARAGSARKAFTEWRDKSCVFISHQQEDTEACEPIAQYLVELGVDVYFDKYDKALSPLTAAGNPNKVTQHIQEGIDFSTHMICVVSPKTVKSYWVPFEVGYGYSRITLGVLTLKGVEDGTLPEYMKTTNVIRGTKSLNNFLLRNC
ncbi:MAG TPA: toll/interleukin-1 receptor domain-containing protein [Pyrinomonadaceae bacterium]|nr:toll/interleukin-1 receptor domain-containing protein [Pyrinomonadaceae bacterium]